MSHRRSLVIAALGLVAALTTASPAEAQRGGCSVLDPAGTRCSIVDGSAPAPPAPGGRGLRSSAPPGPRFVWLNLLVACDGVGGNGWTPMTDLDSAIFDLTFLPDGSDPEEPGVLWIGELIDPATGPTNTGFVSCVAAGSGLPPLPPPPPTAAEIWGAALTFTPQVNLDPYVRGLTGLETYLWYEGPVSDAVSLTLNGYAVAAQIDAVEFRWETGGQSRTGQSLYTSPVPGSAEAPAAVHTYADPARAVVVHEIVWTGTAVLTGPGVPAGGITVDLGEAVLSTARAYDVIEVRTPLVAPGSGDERS
jgi:hypothetical protein